MGIRRDIVSKGKFLALLLRHDPGKLDLTMDKYGWVKVSDLIATGQFTQELLDLIVENNNKGRYAYSPDKKKIRALQGHSIKVDLGLEPIKPEPVLYHGTSSKVVDAIMKEGLKPRSRQYVHLSVDRGTAADVGSRHGGKTVILKIDSQKMYDDGHNFYLSENNVWLTDYVPSEYLYVEYRF